MFNLASLVLHYLGTTFIGSTASLNVREDFYRLPAERNAPTPAEMETGTVQRVQISTDHFRRSLLRWVGLFASGASLVVCLIVLAFSSTWTAVANSLH